MFKGGSLFDYRLFTGRNFASRIAGMDKSGWAGGLSEAAGMAAQDSIR
jgi:hypothetical protein